jgi:high-affinity Fe2+/Pb2+ permease
MFLNILIKATAIARTVASVVTTTVALTFCSVFAVRAQVVTEPRLPQSTPDQGVQFKSSFSGYVPYSEQSIESWREANDRVGEIGGWRVYAKEAQQARSQAKSDTQMLQAPMSHAHPQTKEGKE